MAPNSADDAGDKPTAAAATTARPSSCPRPRFPMRAGLPQARAAASWSGWATSISGIRAGAPGGRRAALRAARRAALRQRRDPHRPCAATSCSRTSWSARASRSATTSTTCPAGTATACRSSGRSRRSSAREGRRKDEVSKAEFRARCREYAAGWIGEQTREFQRLGVLGDWDHRYSTMDFASEAAIVAEFHKFVATHQLYRGSKPVMWSPVERTALADAEVEYHDHVSPTVWVRFPVIEGPRRRGGRRGGDLDHHALDHPRPTGPSPTIRTSPTPPIASRRWRRTCRSQPWAKAGRAADPGRDAGRRRCSRRPRSPSGCRLDAGRPARAWSAAHPLAALDAGYGFAVPLLAGDHVTEDAGTGFVHTAPGHGADDYAVWLAHGHREIPETVDEDGAYYAGRAAVRRAEGAGDRGQEGRASSARPTTR